MKVTCNQLEERIAHDKEKVNPFYESPYIYLKIKNTDCFVPRSDENLIIMRHCEAPRSNLMALGKYADMQYPF